MTLTQNTINALKVAIAKLESRLEIDITDKEVFDYIDQKCSDEEDDIVEVITHDKDFGGYLMDFKYHQQPRTKDQIVQDLLSTDYLPFT